MQTYDLLVIGSGPAGQRAAIYAAKMRKKVALVEMREVSARIAACAHSYFVAGRLVGQSAPSMGGVAGRESLPIVTLST